MKSYAEFEHELSQILLREIPKGTGYLIVFVNSEFPSDIGVLSNLPKESVPALINEAAEVLNDHSEPDTIHRLITH